jgi:hypothetical protein
VLRHSLRADPFDVMNVVVLAMVMGFGLISIGVYLDDGSSDPGVWVSVLELGGLALAIIAPVVLFMTARHRRRRSRR